MIFVSIKDLESFIKFVKIEKQKKIEKNSITLNQIQKG